MGTTAGGFTVLTSKGENLSSKEEGKDVCRTHRGDCQTSGGHVGRRARQNVPPQNEINGGQRNIPLYPKHFRRKTAYLRKEVGSRFKGAINKGRGRVTGS